MNENAKVDEFWNWFRATAKALAGIPEDPALMKELDTRVQELEPELSWEIGPGLAKPWQLVISPNLNRDLREKARAIVSRAPDLSDWEFHSARQPKDWDYKFELQRNDTDEILRLEASNWTFVLLRYPDGAHEILLTGTDVPPLKNDERSQAAA